MPRPGLRRTGLIPFLNQKENVVGRNKPFDFVQDRPSRPTIKEIFFSFEKWNYKVLFDISQHAEALEKPNSGLDHVARLINTFALGRVATERLKLGLVAHGSATPAILLIRPIDTLPILQAAAEADTRPSSTHAACRRAEASLPRINPTIMGQVNKGRALSQSLRQQEPQHGVDSGLEEGRRNLVRLPPSPGRERIRAERCQFGGHRGALGPDRTSSVSEGWPPPDLGSRPFVLLLPMELPTCASVSGWPLPSLSSRRRP